MAQKARFPSYLVIILLPKGFVYSNLQEHDDVVTSF
jgi:hypothetical protein